MKKDLTNKPLTSSIWGVKFDKNPKYGGVINFASNSVDNKISAFEYGFRLGWQTCWFEHQDYQKGLHENIR